MGDEEHLLILLVTHPHREQASCECWWLSPEMMLEAPRHHALCLQLHMFCINTHYIPFVHLHGLV